MGHTKGKWAIIETNNVIGIEQPDKNQEICIIRKNTYDPADDTQAHANAKLIAEAGTVANETGKTPRQLADLNKKLLNALEVAVCLIERLNIKHGRPTGEMRDTIVKLNKTIKKNKKYETSL